MNLRATIAAAVLMAAGAATAICQQPDAVQARTLNGLSFTFDAQHGQLSASGYALNTNPKPAVTSPTTGTLKITILIKLVTASIVASKVSCGALALGGEINTSALTVDGGVETVSGTAKPTPSATIPATLVCNLIIPYEWTLPNGAGAEKGLILAFAAAGLNANGNVVRSTIQFDGLLPLPSNGSTGEFSFDVTL